VPLAQGANHTNSVAHDDTKRPRYEEHDKAGSSSGSYGRDFRNYSPRRERDEEPDMSPRNFQKENRAINFIYGGSVTPTCQRRLKLDEREVNSVFRHSVEPLR
jgi:hypothetical protein